MRRLISAGLGCAVFAALSLPVAVPGQAAEATAFDEASKRCSNRTLRLLVDHHTLTLRYHKSGDSDPEETSRQPLCAEEDRVVSEEGALKSIKVKVRRRSLIDYADLEINIDDKNEADRLDIDGWYEPDKKLLWVRIRENAGYQGGGTLSDAIDKLGDASFDTPCGPIGELPEDCGAYAIRVTGVGTLDPVVRVRGLNLIKQQRDLEIMQFLRDFFYCEETEESICGLKPVEVE